MNILITGAWRDAFAYIPMIEESGHHVMFLQNEKDKLPCPADWAEGVICNGLFLYHRIEEFSNLKYIQLTSAGMDRVPIDHIQKQGIEIHNAANVYSIPIAEFVISSILDIYKQKDFFFQNQKERQWAKNRDLKELYNKTVCIAGAGGIGTECAKRLKAFECRVTGLDKYPSQKECFDEIHHIGEIKTVLSESDIVILAMPLTDETRHIINKDVLSFMKEGSILINTARGALINTEDLLDALDNNVGYAVLDVFEEEPLTKDHPLWNKTNVMITPHNSFVGEGNGRRLSDLIMSNLSES